MTDPAPLRLPNPATGPAAQPPLVGPVGLLGLGLMGTVLAERLRAAGVDVVGYDINAARRDALSTTITVAADARTVFATSPRVILSLPDSPAVAGLLPQIPPAAACRLIIDTTTGDPAATLSVAQQLATQGIDFIDAPISGSSQQFATGNAVCMVGGDEALVDAQQPLFAALGNRHIHLGPVGAGSRAKLASNLVLGLNRLALAEGLVFAEALGLHLPRFLELLIQSPAYSQQMDQKGPRMVKDNFDQPAARLRQHAKDVGLILDAARRADVGLPLTDVHAQLLAAAIDAGDGDLDNSAIIRQVRRQ